MEVELGDLKGVSKDIADVVNRKIGAEVQVKGKLLLVPDTVNGRHYSVKDVKLIMKHALHQLKLSEGYRVLSEQHQVRIVKIEEKKHHAEQEGRAPTASRSLPYFFPG